MRVRNAYLENTFRDQDDIDGCPLIIGVTMVDVGTKYGYIACFHLRYKDGETKYIPITSLPKVGLLETKEVRSVNQRNTIAGRY